MIKEKEKDPDPRITSDEPGQEDPLAAKQKQKGQEDPLAGFAKQKPKNAFAKMGSGKSKDGKVHYPTKKIKYNRSYDKDKYKNYEYKDKAMPYDYVDKYNRFD